MRRYDHQQKLFISGCVFIAVAMSCFPPGTSEVQAAERQSRRSRNSLQRWQEDHRQLQKKFAKSAVEIANLFEAKGLEQTALEIRTLAIPAELGALRVESLPRAVKPPVDVNLPEEERIWHKRLLRSQVDYARELYLLSRRSLYAGFPTYAYQLVREVARHDSDHKTARRILGFVRYGNEWMTPFSARMRRDKYKWHDQFGWLPASHIERYENGDRFVNRRWMSAAKEAEIRRDFRKAWEIRTEHYLVKTNHSLERGVEIARALEDYYGFFVITFAGFFNTPEQLEKLFKGTAGSRRPRLRNDPYEVHYYRTQEEYNTRLIDKIPQIKLTNGLYYTTDRVAYFFHNEKEDFRPTLYHEATHQLFYESERRDRAVGERKNFWIVEGIACYMESYRHEDGRFSLGDPMFERFEAARYRNLVENYYVPLHRFAGMGMYAFQNDPNMGKNYSQASGLAQFFMQYEGGLYRDALVAHLLQMYHPSPLRRNPVQSLAELTSVEFEELDRQYGEFLKSVEASLHRAPAGER